MNSGSQPNYIMISAGWECCGLGENLLPAHSFVKEAPFERNLIAGFHTTRPVSRCQLMRHNGWDTNKNQLKKIWGCWRARHCQIFWAILLKPKIIINAIATLGFLHHDCHGSHVFGWRVPTSTGKWDPLPLLVAGKFPPISKKSQWSRLVNDNH